MSDPGDAIDLARIIATVPEAREFFGTLADIGNNVASLASEGVAELRALAPMLARFGPIAGPTRRQKKTWRRRVSRARWTRNAARFVTDPGRIAVGHFDWDHADRQILPPWER